MTITIFQGKVTNVEVYPAGDAVDQAYAAGATAITLIDPTDFSELGGQVTIAGTVYSYSTINFDTGVMTLTTGLTAAIEDGENVLIYPNADEKRALVQMQDEDDSVLAVVPHNLSDKMDVGIREDVGFETVTLEVIRDQWIIRDIVSLAPVILETSIGAPDDGVPPPAPSTPVLYSALGTITYTWDGKDSTGAEMPADFDHINVYMSDTSGAQTSPLQEVRRNLIGNPSFEVDLTGWGANGAGVTITQSNVVAFSGTQCMKVAYTAGVTGAKYILTGLTIGVVYTYSAYIWNPTGNPSVAIQAANGGPTSTRTNLNDQWQRLSMTFTATATQHDFQPGILGTGGSNFFYIDGCMVEAMDSLNPYFDGDTADTASVVCDWLGVRGQSASVLQNVVPLPESGQPNYIGFLNGRGEGIVTKQPGEVVRYFKYRAVDRAGNIGPESAETAITVNRIQGPDIQANTVTANELIAGAIGATELEAVLALVSKICSGVSGRRWEADTEGIRLYDTDGSLLVNFSTDPLTPNSIFGDLVASSLTVTDQLAIRGLVNEISKGSQIVLSSGTTAPSSPPSVVVDWATIDTHMANGDPAYDGFNPVRWGWARWQNYWWTVQEIYGQVPAVQKYDDNGDSQIWNAPIINTTLWFGAGGCTVLGGDLYVLGKDNGTPGKWWVEKYLGNGLSQNTPALRWEYVLAANSRTPKIANNGTNLIIAYSTTTANRLVWQERNPSTGAAIGSAVTSTNTVAAEMDCFWYGSADFGSPKVVFHVPNNPTFYVIDANGTYNANLTFPAPSGKIQGLEYYNGVFYSHDAAGHKLYTHTPIAWTTESSSWYVSTTWYDPDATGSVHETAQSPRKNFTMKKRARLQVTSAPYPLRPVPNTTDDVTAFRIYLGRGTGDPGRANMEFQSPTINMPTLATYLTSAVFGAPAVTAPPATSNFPATSPAKITSADTTNIVLNGDGSFALGGLTHDPVAGTSLTYGRNFFIGDVADSVSYHYRVRKKATSGANYYELRQYLYDGGTVSGWAQVLLENGAEASRIQMNNVGDIQMDEGSEAYFRTNGGWIAMTPVSPWLAYGAGYRMPAYRKDVTGMVYLRGLIKSGAVGGVIFTLPSGFRPLEHELFSVNVSCTGEAGNGRLQVNSNGQIILTQISPTTATTGHASLSGVQFYADGS